MNIIDNPKLRFRFDRINDRNQVTDLSPNGLNATVKDGCTLVNDPEMGSCIQFDGQKGHIDLPTLTPDKGFDFRKGFTVTAWVQFDTLIKYACILDLGKGEEADDILLLSHENKAGVHGISYPVVKRESQERMISSDKGLTAGEWIHLAFTIDEEGSPMLYLDGIPVENPDIDGTQFLPNTITRSNSYIGKCSWTDKANHFQGRMAWLSVYNEGLSHQEVMQEMGLCLSQWRRSFPLDFSLQTRRDGIYAPVLFIDQSANGHDMHLEVRNTGTTAITFQKEENVFQLRFRQGVLSKAFLQQPPKVSGRGSIGWRAEIQADEKTETGEVLLNFMGDDHLTLNPDERYLLTVANVTVDPIGGARASNVEFRYKGFMPDLKGNPVEGRRLQQLSLVNHSGQRNLPMEAHIIGSSTVLNDDKTSNELHLRIINTGNETIPFTSEKGTRKTQFDIEIPKNTTGDSHDWTLIADDDTAALRLDYGIIGEVAECASECVLHLSSGITCGLGQGYEIKTKDGQRFRLAKNAVKGQSELIIEPAKFRSSQNPMNGFFEYKGGRGFGAGITRYATAQSISDRVRIKLKVPLPCVLEAKTKIEIKPLSKGTAKTAALLVVAKPGDSELLLGVGAKGTKVGALISKSVDAQKWEITSRNDDPDRYIWTVTNQSVAGLGPEESLDFLLSGIVTGQQSGQSWVTIKYQDIPGYWDNQWALPVHKGPMVFRDKRVGIGTDEPQAKLHIAGNDQTVAVEGKLGIGTHTPSSKLEVHAEKPVLSLTSPEWNINNSHGVQLHLGDSNHTIKSVWGKGMTLHDVNGVFLTGSNVGIGTTAPSSKLEVRAEKPVLSITSTKWNQSNSEGVKIRLGDDSHTIRTVCGKGTTLNDTNGVFITGGNVGIGTENPNSSARLQVNGQVWDDSGPLMPKGAIIMWSGVVGDIPPGWKLCDGNFNTPDLRNRFIVGAGGNYHPRNVGGADYVTLSESQMPAHQHYGFGENLTWHMGSQKGGQEGSSGGQDTDNRYYGSSWAGGVAYRGREDSRFSEKFKGYTDEHENRPPYFALCFIMKV